MIPRFKSALIGRSSPIVQQNYPLTIDGVPGTIDGDPGSIQGAFENLNNDIYGVVDSGPTFPAFPKSDPDFGWFGPVAGKLPFGATVGARVDTTPTDINHIAPDGLFDSATHDSITGRGPELVTNGEEFESGWNTLPDATITRDTSNVKVGTHSLKSTGSSSFSGTRSDQNIAVVAGEYIFSCWVYGDGVNNITIQINAGGGINEHYGPGGANGQIYPTGWTYVTFPFTSTGTNNLRVSIYNRYAGVYTWYVDAVSIRAGQPAYAHTLYDAYGGNNAVQTTEVNQSLLLRLGALKLDASDYFISPVQLTDGDNFSILMTYRSTSWGSNLRVLAMDDAVNRNWVLIESNADNRMYFQYRVGGSLRSLYWDKGDLDDGMWHTIMLRRIGNSSTSYKVRVDNVDAILGGQQAGTCDTDPVGLAIGALNTGGNGAEFDTTFTALINGEGISDQDLTDCYDWLNDQGYLNV